MELNFNPNLYCKISNPTFSLDGSIVLRGETYEGNRELVVCFDNSLHKVSREKLQPILDSFKLELNKHYN